MKRQSRFKCPYCDMEHVEILDITKAREDRIFLCDACEGGCGGRFALVTDVEITITSLTTELVGEAKRVANDVADVKKWRAEYEAKKAERERAASGVTA